MFMTNTLQESGVHQIRDFVPTYQRPRAVTSQNLSGILHASADQVRSNFESPVSQAFSNFVLFPIDKPQGKASFNAVIKGALDAS